MSILLDFCFILLILSFTVRSIFKTVKVIQEVFKREKKY